MILHVIRHIYAWLHPNYWMWRVLYGDGTRTYCLTKMEAKSLCKKESGDRLWLDPTNNWFPDWLKQKSKL